MDLNLIREQAAQAIREILEQAHLEEGSLFVVGCSSSEVIGEKIGTQTNLEVAQALFDGINGVLEDRGIYLAAQCCEHLNRALVVKREVMCKFGLEQVNAIPQPNHAGGAWATVTYQNWDDAVLVEDLRASAQAGLDIGKTLIGMHIHPVVVPVRISMEKIGEAQITCARRRPKYVGGQRAIYDENLY